MTAWFSTWAARFRSFFSRDWRWWPRFMSRA